jgi:hypothetical protein
MYTPLDFTIESFGEYSAPPLALELIRDASKSFPKAVIWISLDSSTEVVVRTLNENSMIVSTEIELNPGSRVAGQRDAVRYPAFPRRSVPPIRAAGNQKCHSIPALTAEFLRSTDP